MKRDDLPLVIPGDIHRWVINKTDLPASRSNRRSSMFYAGIDAHTKSSTIGVVDRQGRKVSSSTVVTSAEGFAAGLGRWARHGVKAAVEASGITPWICQLLKNWGVKVVVVNPNRVRRLPGRGAAKCEGCGSRRLTAWCVAGNQPHDLCRDGFGK